ncbi:CLUMA_CG003526, isoform A [Clunio marinus]|uniref:CLUMA_CG003526, isoform A n=1 Tax=Clunio marinus TaxID=568069 RepID=A0A1J1HQQ5_9DIPT|nr:CLUMA_CG003526, isoform A [Clunio marinus]
MKLVSAKEFTTKFDIGTVEGKKLKSYGLKMSYLLPLHETSTVHDVTLVVLHPSINTSINKY